MRVRIVEPIFGPAICASPGDELDLSRPLAADLLRRGVAVAIREAASEKAVRRGRIEKAARA